MPISKIYRYTDKQNPTYNEHIEQDVFAGSIFGELVPYQDDDATVGSPSSENQQYNIFRYRPRAESNYSRIEKWVDRKSGKIHWRTKDGNGITSIYGNTPNSRIADPKDQTRIYEWLLKRRFDTRGNCQLYEYKKEDLENVDPSRSSERHRFKEKYLRGATLRGSVMEIQNLVIQILARCQMGIDGLLK